jgi:hypothetical protein
MGCAASVPASGALKTGPPGVVPVDELGAWLQRHKLSQYEHALRDLGASSVEDLRPTGESDWLEVGLKKLEVARALLEVRRAMTERNSGAGGGTQPGTPGPGVDSPSSSAHPAKANVVKDVPPQSRAEAAANVLVGRVEGAREAVEERVEQGQAHVDEATLALAYTAVADAEASLLGREVRLIEPAP